MYNKEEVLHLKEQLTAHFDSYPRLLQEVTGLTRPTINKFFNHEDSVRPSNEDLIYSTSIRLIKAKQKVRNEMFDELQQLTKSGSNRSVNSKSSSKLSK